MFPLLLLMLKLGLCKVGHGQQIWAEDNKSRSGTTNSGEVFNINFGKKSTMGRTSASKLKISSSRNYEPTKSKQRINANPSPEFSHFYFCLFSFFGTHLSLPLLLSLSGTSSIRLFLH